MDRVRALLQLARHEFPGTLHEVRMAIEHEVVRPETVLLIAMLE
ncbi:hypothetical protein [Natrinema salsiterrestre]|nr:hypothetical protein [Natrinema salsiterrestre]